MVCDSSPDAAIDIKRRYPSAEVVLDFGDVLRSDIEAVVIATPPATHAKLASRALEAGKHVLVEKPIATNSTEALELCERAESAGLVLMTDHTYCYTAAVREIRRLFHSGELGSMLFFDSSRINLGRIQPDVNVLWDLAPHDLSILLFVLPDGYRPIRVGARLSDPIGYGQPSVGHLSLEFPGGAIAQMHESWLSPKKVRTTIIGCTKQMVLWDDLDPGTRVAVFNSGIDIPVTAGSLAPVDSVRYRIGDMVAPALPEYEALSKMVAEFFSAIHEHRQPETDGYMGVEVLRILEAADESTSAGGAWVDL